MICEQEATAGRERTRLPVNLVIGLLLMCLGQTDSMFYYIRVMNLLNTFPLLPGETKFV
jgi:hypothetical protein